MIMIESIIYLCIFIVYIDIYIRNIFVINNVTVCLITKTVNIF